MQKRATEHPRSTIQRPVNQNADTSCPMNCLYSDDLQNLVMHHNNLLYKTYRHHIIYCLIEHQTVFKDKRITTLESNFLQLKFPLKIYKKKSNFKSETSNCKTISVHVFFIRKNFIIIVKFQLSLSKTEFKNGVCEIKIRENLKDLLEHCLTHIILADLVLTPDSSH